MEKVAYKGWSNCVRLTNGSIELIVTTDVGPRVIRLGFVGGQNFMGEYEEMLGKTGGDEWRIYGGHRFWHAPEGIPRTYFPDNVPVQFEWDAAKNTLTLTQQTEQTTSIQKQLEITLDAKEDAVRVLHRAINHSMWDIELAPWALTVMAKKGRLIVPQEEYRPHPDYLLPARPLVLWHYTNMADPRFTWGEKFIQMRQDPSATTKQKFGLLNKQGWAAYALNNEVFVKTYDCNANGVYPDYGCNTESYTDKDMLEVETLGPLAKVAPNGGQVEHVEKWHLVKAQLGTDDASIEKGLAPLISKIKK